MPYHRNNSFTSLTSLIQAPQGFLQSDFILPVAKKFLSFVENSAFDRKIGAKNPPRGLYALILLAVTIYSCYLDLRVLIFFSS